MLNFQLENKLADLMGKSMWQTLQQQITLLEAGSRELRELAAKNNKTNSTAEQSGFEETVHLLQPSAGHL